PAQRYEAVGKSPDRPFRRVGRSAQRAAGGAPRGQGRNRRQAARAGRGGGRDVEGRTRRGAAPLRIATPPIRRHRLVGQADRLLQGQYRTWHGRGIPGNSICCFSTAKTS